MARAKSGKRNVLDRPVVFFEGAAAEGAELGCRDLDLMRRVGGGGRSATTVGWETSGSGGPCDHGLSISWIFGH